MKILLAQINTRVGDLKGNSQKIIETLAKAKLQSVDLVIFPELAITGYPPEDLVEKKYFVQKNLEALQSILPHTRGLGAIIGFVSLNPQPEGHSVFNSAAFIDDGKLIGVQHKSLLPNYDVFDEMRHFEPSKTKTLFNFRGKKIGVSICEDSWNDKDFWKHRLYTNDPIEELVHQGADLLINISASPFHVQKSKLRLEMFRTMTKKYLKPSIFVNLVGGNDSLVFDGCSFVLDGQGNLLAKGKSCEEDLIIVDLDSPQSTTPWETSDLSEIYDALVLGTRDYLHKCGFTKALIGLSGGIDSALVAKIAIDSIGPDHVIGVSMPSRFSSGHSRDDARELAQNLGIDYRVIPIETVFAAYLGELTPQFENRPADTTEENIQARIRGNYLMALSNKLNAMVLTTGNKSELAVGYCTIYGDMCGGLAVISDIPKTMVYELARRINQDRIIIPTNTLVKAPSAELRPDQTDQDSLPPYVILDAILKAYVEELKEEDELITQGFDPDLVRRILKLVDRNEYKRRQAAPGLRVTTKAFGYGRRLPIAQGWR